MKRKRSFEPTALERLQQSQAAKAKLMGKEKQELALHHFGKGVNTYVGDEGFWKQEYDGTFEPNISYFESTPSNGGWTIEEIKKVAFTSPPLTFDHIKRVMGQLPEPEKPKDPIDDWVDNWMKENGKT